MTAQAIRNLPPHTQIYAPYFQLYRQLFQYLCSQVTSQTNRKALEMAPQLLRLAKRIYDYGHSARCEHLVSWATLTMDSADQSASGTGTIRAALDLYKEAQAEIKVGFANRGELAEIVKKQIAACTSELEFYRDDPKSVCASYA